MSKIKKILPTLTGGGTEAMGQNMKAGAFVNALVALGSAAVYLIKSVK